MVRDPVVGCNSCCTDAKAVTGAIASNPCCLEDLPEPITQKCVSQRLATLEQKQWARGVAPQGEEGQHSLYSTKRYLS